MPERKLPDCCLCSRMALDKYYSHCKTQQGSNININFLKFLISFLLNVGIVVGFLAYIGLYITESENNV